jgi:HAD superfamily hydrolase (TIGR01509 family)
MTSEIRAILFDFDMTLIDSSYAITACMNGMAKDLQLAEVTREQVLSTIGLPIEAAWNTLWGDFRPEWLQHYRTHYSPLERAALRPFPDTVPLLEKLTVKGIRKGVVTNRRFARVSVEAVGLEKYFEAIVGLESVERPKPFPDSLLLGLEILKVDKDSAIFAGDTDIDMKTAAAAGVRAVGISSGNHSETDLMAAGAWATVPDLASLGKILQL